MGRTFSDDYWWWKGVEEAELLQCLLSVAGHARANENLEYLEAEIKAIREDQKFLRSRLEGYRHIIKLGHLNTPDKDGNTLLTIASSGAYIDLFKLLLEYKDDWDINHQNKEGYTALMNASVAGNLSIIKVLLEHKAEINLRNKEGRSALDLHLSFWTSSPKLKVVKFLVEHGAEITPEYYIGGKDIKCLEFREIYNYLENITLQ